MFASGFGTPVDPAQHPADNSGRGAESGHVRHRGAHAAMADLLGHSSIAITGDIYGHTRDNTARAAVEGLAWPDSSVSRTNQPLLSTPLGV